MLMRLVKIQAMILSYEDVLILVGLLFMSALVLVFFLGSKRFSRRQQATPSTAE